MVSDDFDKACKKAVGAICTSSLSPEEKANVLCHVAAMLKLPCSVIDSAIFSDTLVPPDPETPDVSDEAFADLADLVCPAILQAPLLTALHVLLPALATVAEYHCCWIMDLGFRTEHKLDYLFEVTWEYLHPRQVSLAPYPVDIPPTPPSFTGNPDVPLVDSSSLPLTSAEIFGHLMAINTTDNGSSLEESHDQMPTPHPLEKGKMCATDPVTPSPLPAPNEPPIELVSPAVTSAVPQGTSAGAPGAPPGAVGRTGKTGKAKKGASFADITAKAAKKPSGAELPRQQSKITQHFQPAATAKPAKPPPPPVRPSIVLSLTNHTLTLTLQSHADSVIVPMLVEAMNRDLAASPTHASIRVSTAKWTPKGNLVVFAGPSISCKTLFLALPLLTQSVSQALPDDLAISSCLNVKWGKVLINLVPTGVIEGHPHVHLPATCWQVLIDNNPSLHPLKVCQLPSWVRRPSLFKLGSQSSLVLAYEDPDDLVMQSILAQHYLYAFRAQCKVVKWHQAPPSPIRHVHQQAVKVAQAQANQQGLTLPKTSAVVKPVSARSQHHDGASMSKVAPALLQPSSKCPPSSLPDDPAGKHLHTSSPV